MFAAITKTAAATLLLVLPAAVCAASSGVQTSTQDFNVTSPLDHGVYVCGQKLPITYVLLGDSSGLELNIYMRPVNVNATTVTIAQKADVSEHASSIVTISNRTFWEHSYNYNIPQNDTPAGNYEIVFESVDAGRNTTVPISIRPYVPTSAPVPSATGSSVSALPSNSSPSSSSGHRAQNQVMNSFGVVIALVGFFTAIN
ncbi:hypothetical protein BDB00DRAFT_789495 [Zychaea mexicana]|uniref:uncharacterized protein n=1 Tax=Zychaea mexicana TaxID=64656 RepID=UPI0022FE2B6C|nr:uncharacterized protein BDB00DRAFT_789495 [Zychaea mexicana]KAI9491508.1 hypothetical protein BDB00DRAFT_789495 [Zychaea mexicana]